MQGHTTEAAHATFKGTCSTASDETTQNFAWLEPGLHDLGNSNWSWVLASDTWQAQIGLQVMLLSPAETAGFQKILVKGALATLKSMYPVQSTHLGAVSAIPGGGIPVSRHLAKAR